MTDGARAVRIQLVIGFMCVALVVYFLMLGRIAMAFITSGRPAAIGLGLALMTLPLIGIAVDRSHQTSLNAGSVAEPGALAMAASLQSVRSRLVPPGARPFENPALEHGGAAPVRQGGRTVCRSSENIAFVRKVKGNTCT